MLTRSDSCSSSHSTDNVYAPTSAGGFWVCIFERLPYFCYIIFQQKISLSIFQFSSFQIAVKRYQMMLQMKYLFGSLLHLCYYLYLWYLFPWSFLPIPLWPHVNRLVEVDRIVVLVCNLQTESADPKNSTQMKFLSWSIGLISFEFEIFL